MQAMQVTPSTMRAPRRASTGPGPRLACGEAFESIRCHELVPAREPLEVVGPQEPLPNAVGRMWWCQIGALPVVEGERLVGCLGEDDLLRVCAARARELQGEIADQGEDLSVWERLLAGLTVRDAMTPLSELAVVSPGATLREGVLGLARPIGSGSAQRHILVADDETKLRQIVSIRDVGRHLLHLYEEEREDSVAARVVREVLDVPVGEFRALRPLGHEPVVASIADSGPETVTRIWEGQRGYALVTFFDGGPQGIGTRRDVLRALKDPFARLGDLAIARIMTSRVESASRLTTLGGVFKLMAIGGYRHMPLLDPTHQVECVVSMAEAVKALAAPPPS